MIKSESAMWATIRRLSKSIQVNDLLENTNTVAALMRVLDRLCVIYCNEFGKSPFVVYPSPYVSDFQI